MNPSEHAAPAGAHTRDDDARQILYARERGYRLSLRALRTRMTRLCVTTVALVMPRVAERYAASAFLRPTGARRTNTMARGETRAAFRVRMGSSVLAAEVFGRRGPAVLLVHGWSGSCADMHAIAHTLVGVGYRALTLDFPAHGASTGSSTTLPEMVRAIGAVAQVAGPFAGVVAYSLGAAAVTLALRDGMLDTRSAVLLSPAIGPMAFVERYRQHIGLPGKCVPGFIARVSARAGCELSTLDARRAVEGLTVRALIIHDPDDREVPFEQGKAIADAWPQSRLLTIRGVGHRRILTANVVLEAIAAAVRDAGSSVEPVRELD